MSRQFKLGLLLIVLGFFSPVPLGNDFIPLSAEVVKIGSFLIQSEKKEK
jgi:hypothetical protein